MDHERHASRHMVHADEAQAEWRQSARKAQGSPFKTLSHFLLIKIMSGAIYLKPWPTMVHLIYGAVASKIDTWLWCLFFVVFCFVFSVVVLSCNWFIFPFTWAVGTCFLDTPSDCGHGAAVFLDSFSHRQGGKTDENQSAIIEQVVSPHKLPKRWNQ